MYRVSLTAEQRTELKQLTRTSGLPRRTRDRLEMVRLADAGFNVPWIASHLQLQQATVRFWIKRFLHEGGFAALSDQPHLGQVSQLTPPLLAAVQQQIATTERTWTAQQLADWLDEHHGVRLSRDHLGFLLRRAGLTYKRTERSLRHKQDPEQVATKQAALRELEKGTL
jgi:transposase